MERWLSKSRVLLGLCGVLLIAALNRSEPMVYGMFLFLAVVSFLGFLLPWLSLRSMSVQLNAGQGIEVMEGDDCNLDILIERKASWPAFMVDIETEWQWASHRIVLTQTVPVIRAGRTPDLARLVQFPCRGYYELVAVRLSSGFPLGLIRANQTMQQPDVQLCVLPKAQVVRWPLPWAVADDPSGDLTTRRLGQSFELGVMRSYQHGDAVGRVNWRASARAGELVIQHFQQSGSMRLRLVLEIPKAPFLGDPDSASEQVIRLAVGICDAAFSQGAQLFAYLPDHVAPLRDREIILRALAQALPHESTLSQTIARATRDLSVGEQMAVVVRAESDARELIRALSQPVQQGCKVVVYIARPRHPTVSDLMLAKQLQAALGEVGLDTFMASLR